MIIHEKLKAMVAADVTLTNLIGARFFPVEAPQGGTEPTLPYVVYMLHEDPLLTHNSGTETTRPWKLYLYILGKSVIQAVTTGAAVKRFFTGYKLSAPGATDTDIQAITIDTGLIDLDRTAESKAYPVSLVLDVWEQLA